MLLVTAFGFVRTLDLRDALEHPLAESAALLYRHKSSKEPLPGREAEIRLFLLSSIRPNDNANAGRFKTFRAYNNPGSIPNCRENARQCDQLA